jgi:hypothetical protein
MPAILRKSLPNFTASQLYSQSYRGSDVVVGVRIAGPGPFTLYTSWGCSVVTCGLWSMGTGAS